VLPETAYSRRFYNEEIDITRRFFAAHRKVLELVRPGSRVLEIGCANGRFSRLLQERGCAVVGVELDPKLAAQAQPYCIAVYNMDILALDQEAKHIGTFDYVLLGEVLEHISDPERAIQRLLHALAPAGKLIIVVPNIAFAGMRVRLLFGDFRYSDGGILDIGHLRFFTSSTLRRMLKINMYCDVQISGVPYQFNGNKFRRLGNLGMHLWSAIDAILSLLCRLLPSLFAYKLIATAVPHEK
jgi:SAM-dependent methyltransferase